MSGSSPSSRALESQPPVPGMLLRSSGASPPPRRFQPRFEHRVHRRRAVLLLQPEQRARDLGGAEGVGAPGDLAVEALEDAGHRRRALLPLEQRGAIPSPDQFLTVLTVLTPSPHAAPGGRGGRQRCGARGGAPVTRHLHWPSGNRGSPPFHTSSMLKYGRNMEGVWEASWEFHTFPSLQVLAWHRDTIRASTSTTPSTSPPLPCPWAAGAPPRGIRVRWSQRCTELRPADACWPRPTRLAHL
eukprot:gene3535-biopygen1465